MNSTMKRAALTAALLTAALAFTVSAASAQPLPAERALPQQANGILDLGEQIVQISQMLFQSVVTETVGN
ncbi:hypothetical protein [Streptomyces sp. NPDC017949]|uniref:hypothetical protein n=1 Tax=Streptomyces sp. NPDC017949 TaxID=3365020 RepID=UPI0037A15892